MNAALNLAASLNGALMMTLAGLGLFGALLAWHSWRAQTLAVFAGLIAAQSFMSIYSFAAAGAMVLAPSWLIAFVGSELTRLLFFMLLSAHWLAFVLCSPRLPSSPQETPRLWPWLLTFFVAIFLLACAALAESYALANAPLAQSAHNFLRQIFAGCASGFLLVASGFIAYRFARQRQALWAWLLCAALALLFAVALQYFQPLSNLLVTFMLLVAQVLTALALLADRARFLRIESEVRRGLWENLAQLESTARHLTAAMSHLNAGVVHVDLEGRIAFANSNFLQLARTGLEPIEGRALKEILPQPLYQALAPALQEARRERTATMEASCVWEQQELVLRITHAPLFNEHGKLKGLHLGAIDVTRSHAELREASVRLAEKSLDLRLLQQGLDQAFDAIALTNARHQILYANEAFARSTGLPQRELPRRIITEYRSPEFYPWPEIQKRLAQNLSWRGEVSGRTNGRAFTHEVTIIPVAEAQQQHYFWIERDLAALESRIAASTSALEQRVQQMAKLMKIGEDIRLNVGLEEIVQSVAEALHTLGWQRVAVFLAENEEAFELKASAGFEAAGKNLPRKFRRMAFGDFAPYMIDAYRLGSSFLVKAAQRPEFMPKELHVVGAGEWRERDCLLVPIPGREKLAGLIAVFSPLSGRYPELQHVRDLESYADETAIAIQNHRLLDSHAESERQARALNQIGNAFRAAGTMERVLAEVAAIMTEAMQQPALIALLQPQAFEDGEHVSPASTTEWLAAFAELSRKQHAPGRSLAIAGEQANTLQSLYENLSASDAQEASLAKEKLGSLLSSEVRGGATNVALKIFALRSRAQSFGFMFWRMPEENSWSNEQNRFARELVAQATLTLDNMRLFLQTEEKARALLRANSHTSEFLASVSHELRTPLHGILQFSEILLRGKLEHEQKEHVHIVRRSGKTLLALINDILDLSKIEAGKLEAVWEPLDLMALLRETLETIQPLCDQKSLNLRRVLEPALPSRFITDRMILSRVLTNLLGNAVKFTEAGEIVFSARTRNECLQLEVKDSGIGMPKHRLKEIFEPFRQLESGEARKHGGTGLGLAISQRMMHILGGKIEVESELGKGSTFTVTLPLRMPPDLSPSAERKTLQPQSQPEKQTRDQKAVKRDALILVIDDDATARTAMRFILEEEGYRVLFAESGEKALPLAQREQPDLILMDIMMPNLDGYQVARALKSQKQLKHVPVIALTARAMKGDREKAFAAGCDDYLTKPFETQEILAMIVKWVG